MSRFAPVHGLRRIGATGRRVDGMTTRRLGAPNGETILASRAAPIRLRSVPALQSSCGTGVRRRCGSLAALGRFPGVPRFGPADLAPMGKAPHGSRLVRGKALV